MADCTFDITPADCDCEYPCSCVNFRGKRFPGGPREVVHHLLRGPHRVQQDVHDFHRTCDLPIGKTPAIRDPQLRADLILEEARETAEAITGRPVYIEFGDGEPERQQSLAGAIDGLCDLLATTYGVAVTFGIDLAPFWEEVHRTNMAKAGAPKREDGKMLKPEGWQPPDIEGLLAKLYPGVCRQCGCTPEGPMNTRGDS